MEYKFSDRVLTLKPSAIREIFKYAADPSYISLSAGNPAPEAFPSKQLAAISAKLMEEDRFWRSSTAQRRATRRFYGILRRT